MASWYSVGVRGVRQVWKFWRSLDLAWASALSKSTKDSKRALRFWTMSGRDSARSVDFFGVVLQVEELGVVADVADVLPGALAPHGDAGVGEVAVVFAEDVVGAAGGVAAA